MTPRKDPRRRRRMTRVFVPITVLLLGAALSPFAGAATPKKPYGADVSPHTVPPSSATPYTFTLTNEAKTQMIGAANLTAPTGFSLPEGQTLAPTHGDATIEGSTIELRDLGLMPGETATLTFMATSASGSGSYMWVLDVRQANDFRGSGNSFSPNPDNVDLMTTVVTGLVFVFVSCTADDPCSGTATDGTTTADVDVDSGGTAAFLTIALLPTDAISCVDYEGTSATVDFNVSATDRTKTVTITIPSELVGERSATDFEVCYSSPNGFIDKFEETVPPGGTGLLPDCTFSEEFGPPDNPPCVLDRFTDEDGSVSVSFFAPEADPKGHI